ncbi:MAG: hypothetical protein JO283_01770 [Bradyrhizobium sp.]|nr:hypothetical protein [Bradyrhizobium sp.]
MGEGILHAPPFTIRAIIHNLVPVTLGSVGNGPASSALSTAIYRAALGEVYLGEK